MEKVTVAIGGMDCPSCASKIERALAGLSGLRDVSVTYTAERLRFTRAANGAAVDEVLTRIKGLGFSPRLVSRGAIEDDDNRSSQSETAEAATGGRAPTAAPVDPNVEKSPPHRHAPDHTHSHSHSEEPSPTVRWWQTPKGRLVLASGSLCAAAFLASAAFPKLESWLYIAATIVGVVPVAMRAWALARVGLPLSIETLMTIAAAGALAIGAASEAAVVVFLFAVGELLEGVAARKARSGISALADLVPKDAIVEGTSGAETVPATALQIGQIIRVRPGDRIAADGLIVEGISEVDESPVTGESVAKEKAPGDEVFAGSINQDALLRVKVTSAAENNTIARIIKLVEEAQEAKAPVARFIDRFSSYYTPVVVILACLVVVVPVLAFGGNWETWIYRGLALLLIACPCALVISTPAAIASAMAAGARRGLLVKGGAVLELLSKVRVVALDKTGTLTEGRPRVTNVIAFGRTEHEVLRLAASVETGTSHPLGRAVVALAKGQQLEIPTSSDIQVLPGKGIRGTVNGQLIALVSPKYAAAISEISPSLQDMILSLQRLGKTVIVVVVGKEPIGVLAMRDEPRKDAAAGIAELKRRGLEVVMLTGDNALPAEAVAKQLGIDYRAELLPEDKAEIVATLSAKGPVLKVGDGINDAPALAAASVGIAMGSGTDVALEAADAAILNNNVRDVGTLIALASRAMAVIHENMAIALGLKAIFLVTSVAGLTGLWIAILADTGATVLVTLNSLRLLRHDAAARRP